MMSLMTDLGNKSGTLTAWVAQQTRRAVPLAGSFKPLQLARPVDPDILLAWLTRFLPIVWWGALRYIAG